MHLTFYAVCHRYARWEINPIGARYKELNKDFFFLNQSIMWFLNCETPSNLVAVQEQSCRKYQWQSSAL